MGEVFTYSEGYPYPDWKKLGKFVREKFPQDKWQEAWRDVVIQWLERLRSALGTNFLPAESKHFFLLCKRKPNERESILKFVEAIKNSIQRILHGLTLKEAYGKHVIIIFEEPDDYYRYISYFFSDGQHPMSGGVFLKKGYAHIALPRFNVRNNRTVLAHELAHNALMTLPVPLWLDEGVAQILEMQFSNYSGTGFDHDLDLIDKHRTYWSTETIQKFWSGESFRAEESVELSYSLAKILLNLISSEKGDFKNFLQTAHYRDAGEAAFAASYGKNLGDLATIFLGPGDWSPRLDLLKARFAKPPVSTKI